MWTSDPDATPSTSTTARSRGRRLVAMRVIRAFLLILGGSYGG